MKLTPQWRLHTAVYRQAREHNGLYMHLFVLSLKNSKNLSFPLLAHTHAPSSTPTPSYCSPYYGFFQMLPGVSQTWTRLTWLPSYVLSLLFITKKEKLLTSKLLINSNPFTLINAYLATSQVFSRFYCVF